MKPRRDLYHERRQWRQELEQSTFKEPYILSEYRKHRDSDLWRASRQGEQLCEIILFLQSNIDRTLSTIAEILADIRKRTRGQIIPGVMDSIELQRDKAIAAELQKIIDYIKLTQHYFIQG